MLGCVPNNSYQRGTIFSIYVNIYKSKDLLFCVPRYLGRLEPSRQLEGSDVRPCKRVLLYPRWLFPGFLGTLNDVFQMIEKQGHVKTTCTVVIPLLKNIRNQLPFLGYEIHHFRFCQKHSPRVIRFFFTPPSHVSRHGT